jgi:CHAD domain-containing protein
MGGVPSRLNIVPLPDLGTTDLVASMPVAEAALVCVRPSVARFLALEPAVRLGADPEAIHDMRVAARRIRTALRLFRGAVPEGSEELRTEIRWTASLLGDVRDLDVQRMSLVPVLEDLPAEERAIVHTIDDLLALRRAEAHERLVEGLDSPRFQRLRTKVVELGHGPSIVSEEASRPIAVVAPLMVRKPYRALRRAGKRLGPESPSAALHALRLKCKRARYALEFVSPLYDDPADALISRLVRLQDLLGDLHDAEAATQRWREFGVGNEASLPDGSSFVLGRLAERSAAAARKMRRRYPKTFRAVRGRRWKDLKRAMEARLAV